MSNIVLASKEFQARFNRDWVIPVEPGSEYLTLAGLQPSVEALTWAENAYIGEFDTVTGFSRSLAEQSYANREQNPDESKFTSVDLTSWPFSHINWDTAGQEMQALIDDGNFVVIGGRHYFEPPATVTF